MKRTCLAASALLVCALPAHAQDPEVRREAVQLMERANEVSLSPNLPNLKRVDAFRALGGDSGTREGTFTRQVVQNTVTRDEVSFGDYHSLNIESREHVVTVRSTELPPPEVATLLRITPINLVRFDGDDVIHRIVTKAVAGKNAKCIEFDSIKGQKSENNELCVDPSNGTLLLENISGELIENNDFFSFAGMLIPAKITYSYVSIRRLEISQTMSELTDPIETVLAAPPGAETREWCTTERRPIGVSMPQPKPGKGGHNIDVAIHALIGADGKVHDAVLESPERADLGAEALSLVQQWIFDPAMCNGQPNQVDARLIVHFHGR